MKTIKYSHVAMAGRRSWKLEERGVKFYFIDNNYKDKNKNYVQYAILKHWGKRRLFDLLIQH